ncbi:MAG: methyltransferase domain-containing protein [Planctomycetota bacterium]
MPDTAARVQCPGCQSDRLETFFRTGSMPVHCNVLHDSAAAARETPRGDIELGFCSACGLIYNTAFDASLLTYTGDYENSLHFSARFQAYAEELAARLTEQHGLDGKTVLEIGCGKGDFLTLLAAGGRNRCVGFDSSYEGHGDDAGIEVQRTFWDPARATEVGADLVACRHVLEHIEQPAEFVRSVANATAGAALYFEVPDALYTLRDLGIWDIIYEHCSYFAAPALARVFEAQGLVPQNLTSSFGGQFLSIETAGRATSAAGLAAASSATSLDELRGLVGAFANEHRAKVEHWSRMLDDDLDAGRKVVAWGAGSKGVTFLNTVARGDEICGIVDINTRKLGRFVAGTGQQIVSPDQLPGMGVDVVLIMNPNYRTEIEQQLSDLGLRPRIEVV